MKISLQSRSVMFSQEGLGWFPKLDDAITRTQESPPPAVAVFANLGGNMRFGNKPGSCQGGLRLVDRILHDPKHR